MNKKQQNKFAMYHTVKSVIGEYATAWSSMPVFNSIVAQFSAKYADLQLMIGTQSKATIGQRKLKEQKRKLTAEKAYNFVAALHVIGTANKDVELLESIKISKSQLTTSSRIKSIVMIDRILEHANVHQATLVDLGLDAAKVAELQNLRDELQEAFNFTRNAIVTRKQITFSISKIMDDLDTLLRDSLDQLVHLIAPGQAFEIKYSNARQVVDYHNPHHLGNGNGAPAVGTPIPSSPDEPDDGL